MNRPRNILFFANTNHNADCVAEHISGVQAQSKHNWFVLNSLRNRMVSKFLKGCFEPNHVILEELESVPFVNQSPKFIRISLQHYQFQSESKAPSESIWKVDQISGGQIIIQKK